MLSNGDYLLYLNFIAHRSFNDPTQYPIFPWLVSTNQDLNLNDPSCLRNLSKPIGAISQDKLEQSKSKYFELVNKLDKTDPSPLDKPYLYMSHYSTPGIVYYYLIRKFPSYILKL